MKKLKTKIWNSAIIRIDRMVDQTKYGYMTTNKTVGYMVKITKGEWTISFREDDKRKLWKQIKNEVLLY